MVARRPVGKRSVDGDGTVRVRGRAANGEGSVYFAADGRWRATYRIPGEGRPRSVSGATRDKAIAARDRRLAELAEEPLSPIAAAGAMSGATTIGGAGELVAVQRADVIRCGPRLGLRPRTGCDGSRTRSGQSQSGS